MSPAHRMALAMLAFAPIVVAAQDNTERRNPADPAAAAAPPAYESAFRNYLKSPDQEEASATAWRDANREVGRLGGHAGHARAAAAPDPADAAVPPAPGAAPAGHEHHHGSGGRQ